MKQELKELVLKRMLLDAWISDIEENKK